MRRSIPLAMTALALVALAAAPVPAAKPSAEAQAKAEHARIVKYWTSERVANAKARDLVKLPNGHIQIKAKPQPPAGGTVTGASWTAGGPVLARTGKVLFSMSGGDWVCSATVITDARSGFSSVISAAHCLYDEAADVFASNWMFVPAFDTNPTFTCSSTAYGCWTARALVVHKGWADEEALTTKATQHDFGVAVVAGGGKTGTSTQLDTAVGGTYAVSTTAINTGTVVNAFGYPAAGRYKGKDLIYCAGPTFQDANNANATWGIACNMTGGSSGGPWIKGFTQAGGGTITSLNSYGYQGVSNMYGPKFNANTGAVVSTAAGTTGNPTGAPLGVIVP